MWECVCGLGTRTELNCNLNPSMCSFHKLVVSLWYLCRTIVFHAFSNLLSHPHWYQSIILLHIRVKQLLDHHHHVGNVITWVTYPCMLCTTYLHAYLGYLPTYLCYQLMNLSTHHVMTSTLGLQLRQGMERGGPRVQPRSHTHILKSAREYERMSPHTPKWIPTLGIGISNF
jgi:hypothetical protein